MADSNNEYFKLEGKIAVVTGGMGQLGSVYVEALLNKGVRVAVLDVVDSPRNPGEVFLKKLDVGDVLPLKCNIADKKELIHSKEIIEESFGVPDILVNNAALDSPPDAPPEEVGPFESYPEESFDAVMEINVKGTFLCCQVFGGGMAHNGGGSIINVASTYGLLSPCQDIYEFRRQQGEEFYKPVAYSVSKSAIFNLTRYLATYWAKKGVRVNTLTPGGIFNNQPQEFLDAYCPRVPMGRMADVNEMVGAVIYLASDASTYVTGTNLVVDGGWSAW